MIKKIIPAVCVALLLVLSLGQPGTAQNRATQQELSEEMATFVRSKWETIHSETDNARDEWAGLYRAYDGPTMTTNLAWSSSSGFIVWWENCSRPGSARANHGEAVLANGLLKITPQLSETVPGSFSVPTDFVPVKWGAQHFLIPPDQLMKFVYVVNSGYKTEYDAFLLKTTDYDKKRRGWPAVPSQYARYLGMKPILATVSSMQPKGARRHPTVILNVGKREGVIPEMMFYRLRRGVFVALEVTSVDEHTSEASVVISSGINDEDEVDLKRGWKFSSRVPNGSSEFLL